MIDNIAFDRQYLTFTPEVRSLMAQNNLTEDMFWNELKDGWTETYAGIHFHFYGRLFRVGRNSYGGPEIRMYHG